MSISKELLLKAVEGKAASRLLESERTPNDEVIVRYPSEQDDRQDNLHKQSIRSEVKRLGGDDWKIHISSLGEAGFLVEVRPTSRNGHYEQVPPGPVTADKVIDLDNEEQLRALAAELQDVAERLSAVAGQVLG